MHGEIALLCVFHFVSILAVQSFDVLVLSEIEAGHGLVARSQIEDPFA
jgi:hypothetical protein